MIQSRRSRGAGPGEGLEPRPREVHPVQEEKKKRAQAQPSRPQKLLASDKQKTFLIQTPAVFQFELGKLANQELTVPVATAGK